MEKVISATEPAFNKFLNLESKIEEAIGTEDPYYRQGAHEGEKLVYNFSIRKPLYCG